MQLTNTADLCASWNVNNLPNFLFSLQIPSPTGTPRINTPVIHSVVQTDSVATLVCNATGLGLTYTWLFNARPLQETSRSALNGENLTITGITFSDTGDYVCTASNKAGNVSQVHSLTVIG